MIGHINFWSFVIFNKINKIKDSFIIAAVSIVELESIVLIKPKPNSKVTPLYDKYTCDFYYPYTYDAVCDMV